MNDTSTRQRAQMLTSHSTRGRFASQARVKALLCYLKTLFEETLAYPQASALHADDLAAMSTRLSSGLCEEDRKTLLRQCAEAACDLGGEQITLPDFVNLMGDTMNLGLGVGES